MRLFKYQIIEYEYKSMTNKNIEVAKTLHKTNSRILKYLIIFIFKLEGIKYEVIE